jgi:hypothetical protein
MYLWQQNLILKFYDSNIEAWKRKFVRLIDTKKWDF